MKKAIELIETRKGCAIAEETPRFIVMFRGQKFGELYFNMTGYTGSDLPCPGSKPDSPMPCYIGEKSIAAYRKAVARLNREWAEIDKRAEGRMSNLSSIILAGHSVPREICFTAKWQHACRLADAATELLESLRTLSSLCEDVGLYPLNVEDARAVIAKVEGRTV